MKRIFFSVVFMVLFLSTATAFAASNYNWTGFYVGLEGSYNHGDTKWEYTDTMTRADHTINGWLIGPFLGYNYQLPINLVLGVETDLNYGNIKGSASAPNPAFLVNTEANWLGSTRIRAGYAIWRIMPYVGLGVAYGRANTFATNIATGTDYGETNTYIGWTPSAGLDFAITKNLKARLEYAYYNLGKKTFYTVVPTVPVESTITFDGIKFGLYWTFGGKEMAAAPVRETAPVKEEAPAPQPPPPPPPPQEIKKEAAAAPVIIEKGRVELLVEFDTNKAVVKPQYESNIEEVADIMKKYPDLKIVIEGHTDNVGTEKYNLNLSQKRAEAIKQVMVKKFNIDAKRITAKGYGFSKPLDKNTLKAGRQKNRRVEAAVDYEIKK